MFHTQTAYSQPFAAPRVALGAEVRLATIGAVITAIDQILPSNPQRIELDASRLRFMTEGARHLLLVATMRLAQRDVELVVVGCEPFG